MTEHFPTASEARAKVAFSKTGSITAGMTTDQRRRQDRECILAEMAVARAWQAEALKPRIEFGFETNAMKHAKSLWRAEQARSQVLALIASGTDTREPLLSETNWTEYYLSMRLRELHTEGRIAKHIERRGKRNITRFSVVGGEA